MTAACMPGVPAVFEHATDRAEFTRPAHRAGVELYRAHIVRHAFEPHTHEGFGLGAIESGVERFRHRGSEHVAAAGSLVLMNPDEPHTGRAETSQGWRYHMVYLDEALLGELLGCSGAWFAQAVAHDPVRAGRLSAHLQALWQAREPLAFDGLLLGLVQGLRSLAQTSRPPPREPMPRLDRVQAHMLAHLDQRLTLESLAQVADLSPFHLLRSFQARMHLSPHQWLMAQRLAQAQRKLAAGMPPAEVAVACGLHDQAHLTRAFARRYGVTPARYQRQVGAPRA